MWCVAVTDVASGVLVVSLFSLCCLSGVCVRVWCVKKRVLCGNELRLLRMVAMRESDER